MLLDLPNFANVVLKVLCFFFGKCKSRIVNLFVYAEVQKLISA